MSIKIEYDIVEDMEFELEMLEIKVKTDYPSTPIQIYLYGNLFGTNTDDKGVASCGTSTIKDYNLRVEIADETYEEEYTCSR